MNIQKIKISWKINLRNIGRLGFFLCWMGDYWWKRIIYLINNHTKTSEKTRLYFKWAKGLHFIFSIVFMFAFFLKRNVKFILLHYHGNNIFYIIFVLKTVIFSYILCIWKKKLEFMRKAVFHIFLSFFFKVRNSFAYFLIISILVFIKIVHTSSPATSSSSQFVMESEPYL